MLEAYIDKYISSASEVLMNMFNISTEIEEIYNKSARNYIINNTFRPHSKFVVQIPFYGTIAGDYFLTLDRERWLNYLEKKFSTKSEDLLNSSVKELLNTIVGNAILPVILDFPKMTYSTPRIISCISYPAVKTMQTDLRSSEVGSIGIALSIDLMKLDVGIELDDALIEIKNKNQQLAHADRLSTLGTMSTSIMHELNNPATFISGNIQTLQSRYLPVLEKYVEKHGFDSEDGKMKSVMEQLPKVCSSALDGISRIKKISSAMTEFSRKESGAVYINLNLCLEKAITFSKLSLTNRVIIKYSDNILPEIEGDSQHLEQVIINLLTNAGHALAETANPTIYIHTELTEKIVKIKVIDNGVGIDEKIREKIWDSFYTTKPEGIGIGLGLSISREIIGSFKGTLTYEPGNPKGSEFIITLPLE